MIFVTVGTHEQPFNRLLEYVDKLKEQKVITEEVIMQTDLAHTFQNIVNIKNYFHIRK